MIGKPSELDGSTTRFCPGKGGLSVLISEDDLRRVARAYLMVAHPIQTTVAGPELVEAARKERPGLFEVVAPI